MQTAPLQATLPVLRTHCPACGVALSAHERHSGGWCHGWQCRHRRIEAQRKQAVEARLRDARDAAALASGDPAAAQAPVVRVRWFDVPEVPVPPARREALRQHLLGLQAAVEALAEAASGQGWPQGLPQSVPEDLPQVAPARADAAEVDQLLAQVCACCTGYCCRLGAGRDAFIEAATLWSAWQRDPQATYAELVDQYLARVPPLHQENSCVFHGAGGCVLPRAQRADICNSFECPGLEQVRGAAEQQGQRRFYVVRHGDTQEPLGVFVPAVPQPGGD